MLLAQGFGWEELAETVALVEGLSLAEQRERLKRSEDG